MPICIPIDRRNECREKGGNGFGNDGDPMFTVTCPGGGCGIPLIFFKEIDEEDESLDADNGNDTEIRY